MKLRVYGEPVPQGSTRAFAVRKGGRPTGRVVVTGDNSRTKPWRQAIVDAALPLGAVGPARGPMSVTLVFFLSRPRSHLLTGKSTAGQLSPSAPALPIGKPDVDKLTRAVLDALTDAGVWADDAQVAALTGVKLYAETGRRRPGVVIEIDPVTELAPALGALVAEP